jgi:hypothetical protein
MESRLLPDLPPALPPPDRPPPHTPPITYDHGLQVHLQTCSIAASKCISELHALGVQIHLQTHSIMASNCISEFNLILASKCISEFIRTWPPSSSRSSTCFRPPSEYLSSLNYGLQVHLWVHSIVASKYISLFTRSWPPSASLSSLNHRLHVLLQLHSGTICSQIGRMYIYRETMIDDTCHIMMQRYLWL